MEAMAISIYHGEDIISITTIFSECYSMNIPPRYTYCVLITAILAVIGYFIFPAMAIGVLIGGLVSSLFAFSDAKEKSEDASPSTLSPVTIPKTTPVVTSAITSDEDETQIITRAEYAGEVKTIYVGNLPYRANEAAIRKLFSEYGLVLSVRLVKDRDTGKRRGYGFVEMPSADADAAIAALNEAEYLQRTLKVREANEKKEALKPEDESAISAEL